MPRCYSHEDTCLWTIDSHGILWQINTINRMALPTIALNLLPSQSQITLFESIWRMWQTPFQDERFRRKYTRAHGSPCRANPSSLPWKTNHSNAVAGVHPCHRVAISMRSKTTE